MIRKCNLLALALGFALSMNSCHLLKHQDNEDPKPQTKGWIKGSLRYQSHYYPTVICETPCDWTIPLQSTLYFTKLDPNIQAAIVPSIVDSTTSDAEGNFRKQLPEGVYYLLASEGDRKYVLPGLGQCGSPPSPFSFEVKASKTTEIRPVIYSKEHPSLCVCF